MLQNRLETSKQQNIYALRYLNVPHHQNETRIYVTILRGHRKCNSAETIKYSLLLNFVQQNVVLYLI